MTTENNKHSAMTEENDFDLVKEYLLQCPHVPQDSPAIKSALDAVEKEKQRRIRDAKLQAKFGGRESSKTAMDDVVAGTNVTSTISDGDVVVVDNVAAPQTAVCRDSSPPPPKDCTGEVGDDQDSMEWQDVQQQKEEEDDEDDDSLMATVGETLDNQNASFLGKQLAKIAIATIAEYRVHVSSPVSAIAVALHASLRSPILGFACTGVPEDPKSTGGGFAPPVRELSKTQFLPLHWDSNPDCILQRYRKNGTGAMILKVMGDSTTVQVTFVPANSKEPPVQSMTFALPLHVNLDSWNAALKAVGGSGTNSKIAPSLHYKDLAGMLSTFCQTFDLGVVVDSDVADMEVPYVDNTVVYGKNDGLPTNSSPSTVSRPSPSDPPGVQPMLPSRGEIPAGVAWKDGRVPSTLDQAFPNASRQPLLGGDFADDLFPAGLQDPRFIRGGRGQGMGGNLMGPNHPLFTGDGFDGGWDGPVRGGPGSMQPRFDPVYPPGVDDGQSSGGGRRQKPSRTGEPNPDHLPPPNSLGGSSNMFL
jgi:hypothetical protein